MKYPLKYPFSMLFARLGATLTIGINVFRDDEAGVYVATSKDVPGLVLEADSFNELTKEVEEAIPNLLKMNQNNFKPKTLADIIYTDHIAIA